MATTRKKKSAAEEKVNLDSILFKCRDILRQARNSGSFFEKRDMMLTLVFLRFIGERFEDGVENLRKELAARGIFRFSAKFLTDNPKIASELAGKGTGTKIVSKEFETMPKVFLEKRPAKGNYIELIGRFDGERVSRFIRRDWLEACEYLDCYKVFVPEANGTGAIGEVLSTPLIGSTDTFISVGRFSASCEAENCMKYIKTKFARTMLGILKATQHNTKATWRYVPLQDFSSKSDIDWSRPVSEIDTQLYAKYGITKPEQKFIESMIKPME